MLPWVILTQFLTIVRCKNGQKGHGYLKDKERRKKEQRYDYIGDVFRTVLIRDLVAKYKIRNQAELLNITSFMMDNIADENTFEREYSPLLAIKDAYPKVIIARTRHETYQYEGIQVIDLARWCCHKN